MPWPAVAEILRRAGWPADSPRQLAARRIVSSQSTRRRRTAARWLAESADVRPALQRLLASADADAHRLALELVGRGAPTSPGQRPRWLELLRSRRVAGSARLRAARALLRQTDADGSAAEAILWAVADGLRRSTAAQRLSQYSGFLGHPPALAGVLAALDARSQAQCPACGERVGRMRFAAHVWDRHGLIVRDGRAVPPYRLVFDAVAADAGSPGSGLERAWLLAVTFDAGRAAESVGRAMIAVRHPAAHVADDECRCPHCFAALALPQPLPPAVVGHGRVAAEGVAVTAEDWHCWTKWLLVGPFVAAAGVAALTVAPPWRWPLTLALLAAAAWVRSRVGPKPVIEAVAIDRAWAEAAGRRRFAARLARASRGVGTPGLRAAAVAEWRRRDLSPAEWCAWLALAADDAGRLGHDPLIIAADGVADCFAGHRPWSAAWLLSRHDGPWHDEPARFRALVWARAFAADWTPTDLAALADGLPDWFGDAALLRRAFAIWVSRDQRPWRRNGPALTWDELAAAPDIGRTAFGRDGDLLAWVPPSSAEGWGAIRLTGGAVKYDDVELRRLPVIGVRRRVLRGGYELTIDGQRRVFAADPTPLAERLAAWASEWLARPEANAESVGRYAGWRERCGECGREFAAKPGGVGRAVNAAT